MKRHNWIVTKQGRGGVPKEFTCECGWRKVMEQVPGYRFNVQVYLDEKGERHRTASACAGAVIVNQQTLF